MLDLVKEYSIFRDPKVRCVGPSPSSFHPQQSNVGKTVLLTGPTGSLGAHILSQLLSSSSISTVYLLVRGPTPTACRERTLKALSSRKLAIPTNFDTKVRIHNCKLSDPTLGLSSEEYEHLAESVDVIIHLAWSVNFLLWLRSFASTHLADMRNLIDLALSSPKRQTPPPRVVFCSSIAAVSDYYSATTTGSVAIRETVFTDPSTSDPTGYARSKWVAEQICSTADPTTHLKNHISIARVGQLSGASDSGVWNAREAYPLMLGSVKATGCLPDLDAARRTQGAEEGEVLGWLPIDIAAGAFVEDIIGSDSSNPDEPAMPLKTRDDKIPVHHILNPSTTVAWSDLLSCLSQHETFETVSAEDWLSRLETLQGSDDDEEASKNHPALKLLGFWKAAFGVADDGPSAAAGEDANKDKEKEPLGDGEGGTLTAELNGDVDGKAAMYGMTRTYERMPSLRVSEGPVNEAYIRNLWWWIKENV